MRDAVVVAITCPHPDCQGVIKVGPDLPAGVYDCICRHVKVRLERADGGPALSLSEKPRNTKGG